MKQIDELIERLEKATGPDRMLDVALHAHFFPESFDGSADHYAAVGYLNAADRRYLDGFVPFYSQSIDADLALVEHFLSGWGCRILWSARYHENDRHARVELFDGKGGEGVVGNSGYTIPIALLLALLRTYESQQ